MQRERCDKAVCETQIPVNGVREERVARGHAHTTVSSGIFVCSQDAVQAKSVPMSVFLFCTNFQMAYCLGISSSCRVAEVEVVILAQVRMDG